MTTHNLDIIPITGTYGGQVEIAESNVTDGPHIWLTAVCPVDLETDPTGLTATVPLHLTAAEAWRLAEQIQHVLRNHHQGDATPHATPGRR